RGAVKAVAFSPDGKLLASGGTDRRIILWEVPSAGSKPPPQLAERGYLDGHQGNVACLAFSPDGKLLASGSDPVVRGGPAEVKVWDVAAKAEAASWTDHAAGVAAVAFHPSKPVLVSAGDDPGFRV